MKLQTSITSVENSLEIDTNEIENTEFDWEVPKIYVSTPS